VKSPVKRNCRTEGKNKRGGAATMRAGGKEGEG